MESTSGWVAEESILQMIVGDFGWDQVTVRIGIMDGDVV